ncbi:hypothetical protein FPHYL_13355 [Fusarium phyllophilum]|uniref:Uncharacterized protein n=1 Tax=Fusarium phyllophilum TaxID=47803 RepID=A0A8H5IEV2_9HYPO|nr:hypothetical protein FPHYL_13355 [Fusarium phyllophilum]
MLRIGEYIQQVHRYSRNRLYTRHSATFPSILSLTEAFPETKGRANSPKDKLWNVHNSQKLKGVSYNSILLQGRKVRAELAETI